MKRDKSVEMLNEKKKQRGKKKKYSIWIADEQYFTEQSTNAGFWGNLNQMQTEAEVVWWVSTVKGH